MSINSIDHDEMANMAHKWEIPEEGIVARPDKQMRSAAARRRIEMLREIRESGLTIEEARELGLIH
ncbi:hypothetical protein HGP28_03330 [Vibrio sp. SM6]|uniref:Uncharacterized protein n=1 Tax=Vibrio agarilyticus TaxID=2726741 RepID=A0A7X8TNA7_9VIBR|nr:hypothetical protein [Vibrio agarilyticus]NLS11922.1 hypothetical protein [Vibrio agarilyticus]